MKKIKIIFSILLIISMIFPQYSKAVTLSDIISGGETFLLKERSEREDIFDADNERSAIDQLYYILLGIAIVAAFIVGTVLGIQLLTTGATGQAKVKEKLIPFAVGLFVVFGAFGIWQIALRLGRTMLEAPPASLVSAERIDIVLGRSDYRERSASSENITINYAEIEYSTQEELGIYLDTTDEIDVPIAAGQLDLNLQTDKPRSGIRIVNVEGTNGYNAVYDSTSNVIIFTYADLDNLPYEYNGSSVCNITLEYKAEFENDDYTDDDALNGSLGGFGEFFGITSNDYYYDVRTITYSANIGNMKFYDVDGNDITQNVVNTSEPLSKTITYRTEAGRFWDYVF